jgi:hypothetical protein
LRRGSAGAEGFAFGGDVGEFLLDAEDFPVAILQNQKFLNRLLH